MAYLNHTNYESYYNIILSSDDKQEADRYLSAMSEFIDNEVGLIFKLIPNTQITYIIDYCDQSFLPISFWQKDNLIVNKPKYQLMTTNDGLAISALKFNCSDVKDCEHIQVLGTYGYSDGLPNLLKNAIYTALKLHLSVYTGATIESLGNLVEERSLTMTRKKNYTNEAQNYKFKAITGEIPTNIKQILKRYKAPLRSIVANKCEKQKQCKKC